MRLVFERVAGLQGRFRGWLRLLTLAALTVAIFLQPPYATAAAGGGCPHLEPFETSDGMGYRSVGGQTVIPPRYAMAFAFSAECIAAVADTNGWAYIDREGRVLVRSHVVDNGPDPFREDRARFVRNGKLGFIDRSARVVIDADYAYAEPFERGHALICADCEAVSDGEHTTMAGKKWGAIDMEGRIVVAPDLSRKQAVARLEELRNQN